MKNIAVFISGGGTNLQAIINATENKEINAKIKLVFSNKKNAYGLERAKKANIETLYLNRKNFSKSEEYDEEILKVLKEKDIDLIVLAGYLGILTSKIISNYRGRIINIHPSLIPSFCGSGFYGEHVHKAVIKKGVKITGATTHFVDEIIDGGAIIMQDTVPVQMNDDYKSIAEKVLEVEHKILVKTVKAFCENRIIFKENGAFITEE
ncbi:MAG: phosphoribosylglycinamide formyltransferase [Dialister micraerophilus]|uniref:Phosphoribosylglycinamide formyltransferase n=1 Tax=Dialister micraerophilus DSM 19965 TaxID=888062 RepID=F2BW51_9FIRM|nr:phosphoribosylglycinamide formyltransferase [Dialister micraerophilus]EGF15206.1 phosphoribosylglycinamide formyltransferase [Dialister micraerophilus DSM 19965]MDK8285351.1 phosphoribosylglycinamide formyltransferase [Dialister micraerophilus]MDU1772250.1 phosphoribosylglycinamide formyltransferase [Dialister micraerophilus]